MRNVVSLFVIVLTIAASAYFGFQLERAGQPAFLLWLGVPTLAIALVGVLRAHSDGALYRRRSFDGGATRSGGNGWLNTRSGDFTRGFIAALGLFAAAWAFTRVVAPPSSDRDSWVARLYLQIGDPSMLRSHVGIVVGAIIVLAIAQELLWRGFVTALLEEVVGSRRAWVVAAFLYAAAQLPTLWVLRDPVAGLNPLLPIAALAAGLTWGLMARKLERLWPGIFAHILFDWTVVMMFRLWRPGL